MNGVAFFEIFDFKKFSQKGTGFYNSKYKVILLSKSRIIVVDSMVYSRKII